MHYFGAQNSRIGPSSGPSVFSLLSRFIIWLTAAFLVSTSIISTPTSANPIITQNRNDTDWPTRDTNSGVISASYQEEEVQPQQCRQSCPILTARTLGGCVDLCRSESGHCCGNQLNGEDSSTGNSWLTCANGCEIAFYVRDADTCKQQCQEGNSRKGDWDYKPDWSEAIDGKAFSQSSNNLCLDPSCLSNNSSQHLSGEQDCYDGCDLAATLSNYYSAPTALRLVDNGRDEESSCDGSTPDIPRFLFAGQSNMVGYSSQAKEGLFEELIQTINARRFKTKYKRKQKKMIIKGLKEACNGASASTKESSGNMAKLIYRIAGNVKSRSVLNDETIMAPHPTSFCSFTDPSKNKMKAKLACERPVTHTACGNDNENFGPELLFAHLFPKLRNTRYHKKSIGITKVAAGGTKISQWVKTDSSDADDDNYWNALQAAIHADYGTIEGFVWFQGESDHFKEQLPLEEYLASLTKLVKDVRIAIFDAYQKKRIRDSNMGILLEEAIFKEKEDIPVVIVELGSWIGNGITKTQGNAPGNIIVAQRQFVRKVDPNAILVQTGTHDNPKKRLSGFYHFDAASQMIIGVNIAKALRSHLWEIPV